MQVMASYGTDDFRIGGNYLYNKDKAKSATTSTAHGGNSSSDFTTGLIGDEVKSSGWDVWAWAKLPDTPFGVFGRFEMLDNKKTSGGIENPVKEKITRFVAGLEYSPIKNVTFAAVVDMTKLKNRGGISNVTDKDTRFGLYTQVKL
jgi:predicted porin